MGRTKISLIWLIDFYQKWISVLKPPSCRFSPTCSQYAKDAILKYGSTKGSIKAIVRLSKCHPFHPGGNDPA